MSSPVTVQHQLLKPASEYLTELLCGLPAGEIDEFRFSVLESCAARIGGFSVEKFAQLTEKPRPGDEAKKAGSRLADLLAGIRIAPSVGLCVLAAGRATDYERKTNGIYYTDFRLAQYLASKAPDVDRFHLPKIVDPASGTGILLVAYALRQIRRGFPADLLLANCIYAVDLSADALRGAMLALASLSTDLRPLQRLKEHIVCTDSLLAPDTLWHGFAPGGFDAVIANPPWERLRVLAHEHLKANGDSRHYGDDYGANVRDEALTAQRQALDFYKTQLTEAGKQRGKGEQDLYKLFVELAFSILRPGGRVSMLIPAGLIRSQGAQHLRVSLAKRASRLEIVVADNKARFFSIDTRFKFLAMDAHFAVNGEPRRIVLKHGSGNETELTTSAGVEINPASLKRFRPDLTIPEVRNQREWSLFSKLSRSHPAFGFPETPWKHRFYREVDMTLDKNLFSRQRQHGTIPVLEGRMVHQFQFGAKAYRNGTGRKAVWETSVAASLDEIQPQFFVDPGTLPPDIRQRSRQSRVGFCDVTGQTNERTTLATLVPAGCVCGNKVPTLEFGPEATGAGFPLLWIGLANSFVFDWLVRRVCTTTLNFFIMDSIPVPLFEGSRGSVLKQRIVDIVKQLLAAAATPFEARNWQLRAELEDLVAEAYSVNFDDFELILSDFPQLDKNQPPIPGEKQSTITRDLVLHALSIERAPEKSASLESRIRAALSTGAKPFVPNQFF